MIKVIKKRKELVLLLIICVFVFTGCVNDETSDISFDISEYESICEEIIDNSSKEFLGNHPVDENFIGWFIGQYGSKALKNIIKECDYNNPDLWYQVTGKSIHVLWYEYSTLTGINDYDNSFTYVVSTKSDNEVIFDFTGDLSMADNIATTNYMSLQKNGLLDCFSDELHDEVNNSDVYVINNEFCYTKRGNPIVEKYYTFRSDPNRAKELNNIGCNIVSLANNHVFDYREEGLVDTFDTLDSINMPYVGAGNNLERASRPIYYIANGKKIAIVAGTQIERSQNFTKEATDDSPGVLKCLDPEIFCNEIKEAKANADYVLCIAHWGTEYEEQYGEDQYELAKEFVKAGSDAIIGGHTHCLQGVDCIDDVPVFYSLGNYWFAVSSKMPEDYETCIARIVIDDDGKLEASMLPCKFQNGITSLITEEDEKQQIFERLNNVSNDAKIQKNGVIASNKVF